MASSKRVLVLHTGGTLGMTGSPLEPGAYGAQLLDAVPELSRIAELSVRIVCNLDSSDLGPDQWTLLAEGIAEEWGRFDGFVVVHGTDTMAFTAAALAFALSGLDRPVVLTGAQRPLAALRTDARRNLADAVELATGEIPEVGICFDGLLLRGCRSVKADASSYRAFESPGVAPLAILGTRVALGAHVRKPSGPFRCNAAFDPGIDVIYLIPGLGREPVAQRLARPGLKGIVLAAFGGGTVADNGIAEVLAEAVEGGIEIVAVTQWGGQTDLSLYRNSRLLAQAGVIEGGAMRISAAVPKLMHAMAAYPDRQTRRAYLLQDVAGERGGSGPTDGRTQ